MRSRFFNFLEPSPGIAMQMELLVRCLGGVLALRALKLLLMHASYVERTTLLFDYWLFGWLPRPPAAGVYALLATTIVCGVAMALTKSATTLRNALVVGATGWSYFFLLDKAFYGNLNYLLVCLLWTLVLTRAWRAVDRSTSSQMRPIDLGAVQMLIALMYFYAGVVKLSADWLSGDVLAEFLTISPAPGPLAAILANRPTLVALAFGGALFDLSIGPLLCWKRTRRKALWLVAGFHITNFIVLDVPEVALAMLALTGAAFAPSGFAKKLLKYDKMEPIPATTSSQIMRREHVADALLLSWLALHILLPLRPYLPDGEDHRWTHTSQDFSWWLRSTHMSSTIRFDVRIDDAPAYKVDVSQYVDVVEQRAFALDPYLITQFVHHLHARLRATHPQARAIRIEVTSTARLNRCEEQAFVRSEVDLIQEPLRYDMHHVLHPLDHTTCRTFDTLFTDPHEKSPGT